MMRCGQGAFPVRWFVVLTGFLFGAAPASATIRYQISLAHGDTHRFQITMLIRKPVLGMTVALPAWNALYQVRDFACRVRDVAATSSNDDGSRGAPLPVVSVDKQTWRIGDPQAAFASRIPDAFSVAYSIEWNDPGPFNSQLNEHHAFLNLAEILMYLPDRRAEDVEVHFENVPAEWKLMAELPAGLDPHSFTAPSYDALVDAPVEAGKFDEFEFDNAGATFRVAIDSRSYNKSRLEGMLQTITSYEIHLMGGAPFKEYTFLLRVGPRPEAGGGGMEHASCAAMSVGSIEALLNLSAHEFFHAWNVKRIRPQSLEPVDYTKEQYTRALWFAEGVTSTYAAYTLERTGLWSKEEFYDDLAAQIGELESRPAHKWQSAEDSSLEAWLEKYEAYNLPDRSISYYNKGQILGVMLDLAIRDATDNHKSLDDVMRRMNDEYAKQGKFYEDRVGIRGVVQEVAGISFEDFFRRYVAGVDEIPFDKFFAAAGLQLNLQDAKAADLGFTLGRASGPGVAVSQVESGSAADVAGLRSGDVIVERNGQEVPRARRGWLRDVHPGDAVNLRVVREGQLLNISYVLASSEEARYSIAEMAHPTDKQRRIRVGLLRGTTN
jgi:predicted metalloprotease with PDZ domain